MNYTAFTAVIITFHHLSAIFALVLALLLSTLIYWLFIKKRKNRLIAVFLTFFVSFIIGAYLADEIFHKKPIGIEIVSVG